MYKSKQKKWLLPLLFLLLAAGSLYAFRYAWIRFRPHPQEVAEQWSLLAIDPWKEFSNVVQALKQSLPFHVKGKAALIDSRDSVIEMRSFNLTCFDTSTTIYQVEQVEVLQTVKWQAVIDAERQKVEVSAASGAGDLFMMGMTMEGLQQLFATRSFEWKVMQSNTGKRRLVSANYRNAGVSGLEIQYEAKRHQLLAVTTGMPSDALPVTESDATASQKLQISYETPVALDTTIYSRPDRMIRVAGNHITVQDPRYRHFGIQSHIR